MFLDRPFPIDFLKYQLDYQSFDFILEFNLCHCLGYFKSPKIEKSLFPIEKQLIFGHELNRFSKFCNFQVWWNNVITMND